MINKFIGGGYAHYAMYSLNQIQKGGNGTSLTSFLPRLPKGGLRCEGEVTHRG